MKFCKKCEKQTPTINIGEKEECMVCGAEVTEEGKKSFVNEKTIKSLRDLTKIDSDSGKYKSANDVGRGVLIGILVILMGILYSIGGVSMVFSGIGTLFLILLLLAIGLWIISVV